jgi:thioredoxin reductase
MTEPHPGLPTEADVIIIGAGPAGLAAAAWLGQRGGLRILVLDREAEAGGVPRHCSHSPYGLREFRRLLTGPSYAKALVRQATAAGAQIRTGVSVTRLAPGPRIEVTSDAGPATLTARAVLLATGARETTRAERLIGGTKPQGVLSTGALQLLLASGHIPFRSPAILGTELVAFSALLSCRLAGIRPVAMLEPGSRTTARWPTGLFPRLQGIPLLFGTDVTGIEGEARVSGLRLSTGKAMAADGLIVTGQFRPDAPLLAGSPVRVDPGTGGPEIDQFGRCSEPGFFAAGNLLRGVETAGWCWAEGQAVAGSIHAHLTGRLSPDPGRPITLRGPISAHVPQRIAPGPAPSDTGPRIGLDALQLRVSDAVSGRLGLWQDGSEIAGRVLHGRPERRILLPLPRAGAATEVSLSPTGAA